MRRYTAAVTPPTGPSPLFGFTIEDEDGDVVEKGEGFSSTEAAYAAATKKVAELKMADRFD